MLTEEQRQLGRRDFLKAAAALPAIGAFAFANKKIGPLRVGCIGTGSECGVLQEQMNRSPDFIRQVAVCDIYPPHRAKGLERARVHVPEAKDCGDDYKKLLADDSIEAVVIAVPLWKHAEIALDAMKAGKHVFTEKTMAYTIDECDQMVNLAKQKGLVLQVGHQRFYNPIYHQMVSMIKEGLLGDIYHIRMLWHRNTDWRANARWTIDESFDPTPWGYQDLEHLINWRLYKKHSQGLMTELCSHQIAITNWIAGCRPTAISASAGIYRYKDDGREWADHAYAIFEYPKGLTVTYSSIQSNRFDNYYEELMGTKGTLILTGETQAMFFPEPGNEAAAPEEKETTVEVAKDKGGPAMQASASRVADAGGKAVGSGAASGGGGESPLEAYKSELEGFAHAIRTGERNLCDGEIGRDAAVAMLKANEAIEKGQRVELS